MRLAFLLLLAAAALAGASGCRHFNLHKCSSCGVQAGGIGRGAGPLAKLRGHKACGPNCNGQCGPEGCGPLGRLQAHHAAPQEPAYAPGPPTAAYAYPYYTTRGPRDFLQDNPMSIGP